MTLASLDSRNPPSRPTSSLTVNDALSCASTLDSSKLNDNYCDCTDGSDDEWLTGACGVGDFTCTLSQVRISSSWVFDGVCDCCDGSDEAPTTCVNRCATVAATSEARLRAVLQDAIKGLQAKESYVDHGAASSRVSSWKASLAEAVDHWEDAVEAAEDQLDALTHRFDSNPSLTPTDQDHRLYQQLHGHVEHAKSQLHVYTTLATASFGADDEFATLLGHCFDFEVNEKELKGGTSNTIARTYVMVYCPFVNVTQTEPGYHAWRLAQKQAQVGDKYTVQDDAKVPDIQRPILLGLWRTWLPQPKDDNVAILFPAPLYVQGVPHEAETRVTSDMRPPHQLYGQGEVCGGRDDPRRRSRRVTVEMHCASRNHIKFVEERAWCDYVLGFGTPAACTDAYIAHLENAFKSAAPHDEL
ncbi:hypothetical protein DYB25_009682 [Aphanomyces astaci]|uniref:MRH domain-containing protein n=1 Tax=Aphanomyces astaci TaxID=112090 RepID=A0A397B3E3_APHAT|nr:hypothetical protein DYB36_003546 [Aphanomyces astaci]RHY13065.1 hypothetical protein DYB25_009682 [Aphanomyces astaci]RHY76965.1 hypothetical protein DYB30_007449 [Aphanomyces astaci]